MHRLLLTFLAVTLSSGPIWAQVPTPGTPPSERFAADLLAIEPPTVEIAVAPSLIDAFEAQDALEDAAGERPPYRYGVPVDVAISTASHGAWTNLDDGGRVWRAQIVSPGAVSLSLIFSEYRLPEGAELFIRGETIKLGAFTSSNNKDYGSLATSVVDGGVATVEYYVPDDDAGSLEIGRVIYGYKPLPWIEDRSERAGGYGQSESCNINVNCSAGNPYRDEQRAVALIADSQGRFCSGSLVNNVREDRTPYFLTANHCLGSAVSNWIFYFNYESPGCTNQNGPTYQSVSGSSVVSSDYDSDFALLLLNEDPHYSYEVYFAGWDATGGVPSSTASIHHPNGDIKKIALDYDPPTTVAPVGRPAQYWGVRWNAGITAKGSSSGPLFEPNGRVIGQLRGGSSFCSNPSALDDYGKFSESWTGSSPSSRLRDHLDPDNTGTLVLNGKNGALGATVAGPLFACEGDPIAFSANVWGGDGGAYSYLWEHQDYGTSWFPIGSGSPYASTTMAPTDVATRIVVSRGGETFTSFEFPTSLLNPTGCGGWGGFAAAGGSNAGLAAAPTEFAVSAAYPNPTARSLGLRLSLATEADVTVVVYDLLGRTVLAETLGTMSVGVHELDVDASALPPGHYVYRLSAGPDRATSPFVVII